MGRVLSRLLACAGFVRGAPPAAAATYFETRSLVSSSGTCAASRPPQAFQFPAAMSEERHAAEMSSAAAAAAAGAAEHPLDRLLDETAEAAAAEVRAGRLPSPANLKPAIAVLVRALESRSAATVNRAAVALLELCKDHASNHAPLVCAAGAPPLLVAALEKEATGSAAAALIVWLL